jgi:hypothetical protein
MKEFMLRQEELGWLGGRTRLIEWVREVQRPGREQVTRLLVD